MRLPVLVFAAALAAGCGEDPPVAPPAPPTAADDSVSAVLADTAGATVRYVGRRRTLSGEGALVRVWLRPEGLLVWAEDAIDGGPLQPQRGSYDVVAGTSGRDTLTIALAAADSVRFVCTADSLLETRRDTLVVEHLLRLVRNRRAGESAPPPAGRAPSTNTPATPDEAAREAVEAAAREAERLPGGSPAAPRRQAPRQ